jgi:hypothetical protein
MEQMPQYDSEIFNVEFQIWNMVKGEKQHEMAGLARTSMKHTNTRKTKDKSNFLFLLLTKLKQI